MFYLELRLQLDHINIVYYSHIEPFLCYDAIAVNSRKVKSEWLDMKMVLKPFLGENSPRQPKAM